MKFYMAHTTKSDDFVKANILPKLEKVVEIINPFSRLHWKEEQERFLASKGEDISALAEEVVDRDMGYIDECDGIIAYVPYPSIGTSMEIIYAQNHCKIVLLIVPSKELQNHPWLLAFSDKIFKNVEDLVKHLNKIYL